MIDPVRGLGLTAILVAGARAAESARSDRLFDDPLAPVFVEAARTASPGIAQALEGSPDEAVNQARRDSVAVRTRFLDDYLSTAAYSGCRQIVLLAAGLDGRAFRLAWPAGVRLWEIDMPDLFAFKERVIGNRKAIPACDRRTIPADLRDDWTHALIAAGFDSAQPTAWLVEGLLMYLDESERDLLMDRIGALSAPGSRIALDHRGGFFSPPPVTSEDDPSGDKAAARFAALAAAASSDPSLTSPEVWLTGHGWRANILDAAAVFARYRRPAPLTTAQGWMAEAERV